MPTYSTMSPRPDAALAHRRGDAVVTVTGRDGRPLPDAEVTIAHDRLDFGLGCTGFDLISLANGEASGAEGDRLDRLAEHWLAAFDSATLPFYWGRFEPERGRPDTARLRAAARWFVGRGVRLKGHPLVWHTVCAPWLLDLPLDEVEQLQRDRIARDVADFAGLVDTWDAVNEAVIMPVFTKEDNGITRLARRLGRLGIIRLAFEEARRANPDATLLLNDFDTSTAYDSLLEGVLEAGFVPDALGVQSHQHQGAWHPDKLAEVLDRFSRYGLPLHFTETTFVSGALMPAEVEDLNDHVVASWPSTPEGEERQARDLDAFYRTLFAHPAVTSVTYWGLSDAGAWLGAPAGLVRADGTPKPAYGVLRGLVEEWRTPPAILRTDAAGRVRVAGWRGDYTLSCAGASGAFAIGGTGGVAAVRV